MSRIVVALIIYRNRYLISNIPDGEFAGQWEFPGGPANAESADFEAVRNAIKEKLGVDIFPYMTAKRLFYKSLNEKSDLTLIKCSISDETKRILSVDIPTKNKWLNLVYAADIDFAPRDKQIFNYLTDGKPVMAPQPRPRRSASKRETNRHSMAKTTLRGAARAKQGFATIDKDRLFQIASSGGKAAHALGRAHRWTPAEAQDG